MLSSLFLPPDGILKENLSKEDMGDAVRSKEGLLWVDFKKPDADEIFMLDDVFGFHPLAIEDCQHRSQLPKLDDFGNHIFIVFLVPNPLFDPHKEYDEGEEEEPVQEVDFFLGPNYVVTVHAGNLPFLGSLLAGAKRTPKGTLNRDSAFLVHDIMDAAVDLFFTMVEKFEDEAEKLEALVQDESDKEILARVFEIRGRVLNLRRQMMDHRELITRLIRRNHPLVKKKAHIYFRNILDHLNRIIDDLDVCRDTLNTARDVHLALANMRTNEVMKTLTLVFAFSLPFTILTGWYGMNFKNLPLQNNPYGPWALSGAMAVFVLGIGYWLKKKQWF